MEKPYRREDASDTEAMIDETLDESFPASDPPSWSSLAAQGRRERADPKGLTQGVTKERRVPEAGTLEQRETALTRRDDQVNENPGDQAA